MNKIKKFVKDHESYLVGFGLGATAVIGYGLGRRRPMGHGVSILNLRPEHIRLMTEEGVQPYYLVKGHKLILRFIAKDL